MYSRYTSSDIFYLNYTNEIVIQFSGRKHEGDAAIGHLVDLPDA